MTFQTTRLRFRSFQWDDLQALARISADPETSHYVGDGRTLSLAETRQWIENSRRNVEQFGYGTGAVVLRENATLIGWAGIARPAEGQEEIIYGLDRAYWGAGFGTELLAGIIHWSGQTLGLSELRATVDPDNVASIAMLRRQGFVLVDPCYEGDPRSQLYVARLPDE